MTSDLIPRKPRPNVAFHAVSNQTSQYAETLKKRAPHHYYESSAFPRSSDITSLMIIRFSRNHVAVPEIV